MQLLVRLITNTCQFFNVQSNMDNNQITMTASTIIDDYGGENVDDVVLALKMARSGAFGKLYGRLDGEIIIGWIALYLDRKYEEVEKQHHNRKHEAVNMAEIHPKVLESVKVAAEKKTNGGENGATNGGENGKPGSDNGGVMRVDHETWNKFWLEFRDTFTVKQLKSYREQFNNNNMFGYYADQIKWIDDRTKELHDATGNKNQE